VKTYNATIVGLLLTLGASAALAADWVRAYLDPEETVYIDRGSIVKKGKYWRSWSRTNFFAPELFRGAPANGTPYSSVRQLVLFDCEEREMYILSATYFRGPDLEGGVVVDDPTTPNEKPLLYPVTPDSVNESRLDYVCQAANAKPAQK